MKPLNEVVAILKQYPAVVISVEGHTDNVGKTAANKKLSQRRADAIKAYLIKQGIAADRLAAAGFGSEQPVASNATAKGRSENRRVEIKGEYRK